MNRFAGLEIRERRSDGSSLVTGTEVLPQASGASCFITTDSEKSLVSRQASQVEQIELRTYVFLDSFVYFIRINFYLSKYMYDLDKYIILIRQKNYNKVIQVGHIERYNPVINNDIKNLNNISLIKSE